MVAMPALLPTAPVASLKCESCFRATGSKAELSRTASDAAIGQGGNARER